MIKNTKLRSEGVKRARELIYTAERQASRDVSLAGLSVKNRSLAAELMMMIAVVDDCY
jgi:hypothetical protein